MLVFFSSYSKFRLSNKWYQGSDPGKKIGRRVLGDFFFFVESVTWYVAVESE